MDAVLEVIGVRTREHAEIGAVDSLRQWSAVQRCTPSGPSGASSVTMTDSALGDEIDEEAIEATEYIVVSEDSDHS